LTRKKYNKIAVLGKSLKFIKEIKKNYNHNTLTIIPWRQIEIYLGKKKNKYDLIFIGGFNFDIYKKKLSFFKKKNIFQPFKLIKKISNKKTLIIYINTQKTNNNDYTFSRYRYAKQKLAYLIYKGFENSIIFNSDLIKVKNHISINSNTFSKSIFYFFSFLKLIKTIDIEKIFLEINNMTTLKKCQKQKNIKGYFLQMSRTQFLDRILRLI
tara:strand:- start:22 stop:654 length:633 start_codon:yes stop_codon:yes gene_type:complete